MYKTLRDGFMSAEAIKFDGFKFKRADDLTKVYLGDSDIIQLDCVDVFRLFKYKVRSGANLVVEFDYGLKTDIVEIDETSREEAIWLLDRLVFGIMKSQLKPSDEYTISFYCGSYDDLVGDLEVAHFAHFKGEYKEKVVEAVKDMGIISITIKSQ